MWTPYKLTKADFRPRTRPGFYQRGHDVIRIDFVEHTGRPPQGRHLGVGDWWVTYVGTLTSVDDKSGPRLSVPAVSGEMKVFELHSTQKGRPSWRRMNPEKLSPAWKAWFDKHPPFVPDDEE
jgi:hypothetical protein